MVRKTLNSTGEQVDMTPNKEYERDTSALCGSRHTISVGTTYNPNGLVPFDDYMVVYLKPEDTGGGGHIEDLLIAAVSYAIEVGKGIGVAFSDPEEYAEVTLTCREVMEQRREDGEAGALEYYTYVALDETVGNLTRGIGGLFSAETDGTSVAYRAESPFYSPKGQKPALTFALEDASVNCDDWQKETYGGCYHGGNGATHKVRITITNEYEGKTTTPYIFDLAGCNATYDKNDKYCPEGEATKRFLITKPGKWTIRVQPIATAECAALNYTNEWSFDVAKPADWEPPAIQTLTDGMSEALQEVGLPINVTPLGFVIGASLIGGLLLKRIWKNKQARKKEEQFAAIPPPMIHRHG